MRRRRVSSSFAFSNLMQFFPVGTEDGRDLSGVFRPADSNRATGRTAETPSSLAGNH
jgi:hypothetical protein